jgi:hypothetical protein
MLRAEPYQELHDEPAICRCGADIDGVHEQDCLMELPADEAAETDEAGRRRVA